MEPSEATASSDHDALRDEIREIMAGETKSQTDLARESGVPYGTFTAWFSGKYTGNNARIALEVRKWLDARRERRAITALMPREPGFLLTPTARDIIPNLQFAQVMPAVVTIVGAAGVGKTKAAEHYRDTNPNVWLITAEPSVRRVNDILVALCTELDVTEKRANRLSAAIGRRVRGSTGLIILDEAQFADTEALQQLRILQSSYGVGVALLGNEAVIARIGYGNRDQENLFSRVGKKLVLRHARAGDIADLLDAWAITEDDERRFLAAVGRKAGGLRTLTWCLKQASILAAGCAEPRGLKHLRAAAEGLASEPALSAA